MGAGGAAMVGGFLVMAACFLAAFRWESRRLAALRRAMEGE